MQAYAEIMLKPFLSGTTREYTFTFKRYDNPDDPPTPISLADSVVVFTMKRNKNDDDEDAVVQKRVTEHIDAVNGITKIKLNAADTLESGRFFWDAKVISVDGNNLGPIIGQAIIVQSVTKAIE